jgi:hypothetical protein
MADDPERRDADDNEDRVARAQPCAVITARKHL